jgi:hypothetical protein
MKTVYGLVTDPVGAARSAGAFWSTPADAIADEQDPVLRVDRHHDGRWCGQVAYLERTRHGLWCVAEVSDQVVEAVNVGVAGETRSVPTPLYWSPTRIGDRDSGILFTSISLTSTPARVCPQPLKLLHGDLSWRSAWSGLDSFDAGLLERAAESKRRRQPGEPIIVETPMLAPAPPPLVEWTRYETRAPRDNHRIPPQLRKGWKPGDLEWSQHSGRILRVS